MSDFTADEIQSAVEQLVQSSITVTYDTLGSRGTTLTFSQIQQAVAGMFILYPLAPFYCVYLGAKRTGDLITKESQTLASILEAIQSLGRNVLPVQDSDVLSLSNAVSALQALQSAVSVTAPTDITKLAQYQRFSANASTFLNGPAGQAVKQNGAVVPTPQEARSVLPGLMSQLQSQHMNIVSIATDLANSIGDFASVNLPSLVAQGIINNATTVLSGHVAELNALPVADRLSSIRQVILDILTSKAAVRTLGSFSGPSSLYGITGNGFPYSDASHLATPAELEGTVGPPFNIITGSTDQLTFTMDGASPFTLVLPQSTFATLSGVVVEQVPLNGSPHDGYLIGNGTSPILPVGQVTPTNNSFRLRVFNRQTTVTITVNVNLTLSTTFFGVVTLRTAQNIADDINSALVTAGLTNIIAEPYFYPSFHFSGVVNVTSLGGSNGQFDIPGAGGSFVGVVTGNLVTVASGPNAGLWNVLSVPTTTRFIALKQSGSAVTQSNVPIVVGPKDRAVRIRCSTLADIQNEISLTSLGDTTASSGAAVTLGFVPNSTQTCSGLFPSDVVSAVNTQTTKALASTVLINATPCSVNSDPSSPLHVVISKILTTGNVTYVAGSPNHINVVFPSGGLLAADVVVGDVLVLRGQGNTSWSITVVTDTTVTAASFTATATTASGASIEIGAEVMNPVEWDTLEVLSGPNTGKYVVDGMGVSPLDILLKGRTGIPHYVTPANNQLVAMPSCQIGTEVLVFSSVNETTTSSVGITGTASPLFFSSPPSVAVGTTEYFFVPTPTQGGAPVPGDMLLLFASDYNNPSGTFELLNVTQSSTGYILQISPNVSDSPVNWTFTPQPPPFAELKHGHVVDFTDFQAALNVWIAQPVNNTLYFQQLNRLINPLLANQNPTAVQVGDAMNAIIALAQLLTVAEAAATNYTMFPPLEKSLNDYVVDPVPSVNALIKTYTQKGSDRAIDILLQGQFSVFFGLTADQLSYGGNVQSTMKAVAQNDLLINSTNRTDALQSRSLGISQSPDFEFDTSDSDTPLKPDAPQDYEKDI